MEAEFTFLIAIYLAAQKGCDSVAGIQTATAAGCSKTSRVSKSPLLPKSQPARPSVQLQRKQQWWEAPRHGTETIVVLSILV